MPDTKLERPTVPGLYPRQPERARVSSSEVTAIALSLLWLVAVGAFFLLADVSTRVQGATNGVMTFLAVFLPIALIWVAATTARTVRELRGEAERLHAAVDAMRVAYVQQQTQTMKPSVEKKLDEIAAAQRQTESVIATFTSRRDVGTTVHAADRKMTVVAQKPSVPAEEEPSLALGTPADELLAPISIADFIRALNFPESADDKDGFRALRAALEDRTVAKLIRSAQDVLTLLSQDGIYMDDLKPDRARPEIWRKFAQGERGRAIAGLGGVRDRSSLALSAGRMRNDPVFRDAAHHFLRQFDKTFSEFERNASDQEVAELAETRTARAFMLFGRVTGTFD
jgi:hypothetical protein